MQNNLVNGVNSTIKFIEENTHSKLIINQVNEEIGLFYINLVEYEAIRKNVRLNYRERFLENTTNDLFIDNKIDLYISNNKKDIEKYLNSNNKSLYYRL